MTSCVTTLFSKKRFHFEVKVNLEQLTAVPFVNGVVFAKLRILNVRHTSQYSSREEIQSHCVKWNSQFTFQCKMSANAYTNVLEAVELKISLRKEIKGGKSHHKVGFVCVNLACFAAYGDAPCKRHYILEAYNQTKRQDNSLLQVNFSVRQTFGDTCFRVPEEDPSRCIPFDVDSPSRSLDTANGSPLSPPSPSLGAQTTVTSPDRDASLSRSERKFPNDSCDDLVSNPTLGSNHRSPSSEGLTPEETFGVTKTCQHSYLLSHPEVESGVGSPGDVCSCWSATCSTEGNTPADRPHRMRFPMDKGPSDRDLDSPCDVTPCTHYSLPPPTSTTNSRLPVDVPACSPLDHFPGYTWPDPITTLASGGACGPQVCSLHRQGPPSSASCRHFSGHLPPHATAHLHHHHCHHTVTDPGPGGRTACHSRHSSLDCTQHFNKYSSGSTSSNDRSLERKSQWMVDSGINKQTQLDATRIDNDLVVSEILKSINCSPAATEKSSLKDQNSRNPLNKIDKSPNRHHNHLVSTNSPRGTSYS